jgi:hypothetical protein
MIEAILSSSIALAALAGATYAFVRALDAERRCADARVNDATKAGAVAIMQATVTTLESAVAAQKRRADALDHVLDEVATDGDAAGARARVLARLEREAGPDPAAPGGADPGPVHQPAAADVAHDDGAAHVAPRP